MNKLTEELQGDMSDNNTMKSLKENAEAVLSNSKDKSKVYWAGDADGKINLYNVTEGKISAITQDGKEEASDLTVQANTTNWAGRFFTEDDGSQFLLINNGKYCAYKTGDMSGVAVYNSGTESENECVKKLTEQTNCSEVIQMLDTGNTITTLQNDVKSLNDKVTALETANTDKDKTIADLQSQITSAVTVNKTQADQITTLNTNVANQHPVGSFYITQGSENPATLFGGTWTRVYDRFLVGAGSGYGVTSTGGSASHSHSTNATNTWDTTLTAAQSGLPSHSHATDVRYASWEASGFGLALDYEQGFADRGLVTGGGMNTASTGGWNASEGHHHYVPSVGTSSASNIPPYYAVYMWVKVGN